MVWDTLIEETVKMGKEAFSIYKRNELLKQPWLRQNEVAELLGLSVNTIRRNDFPVVPKKFKGNSYYNPEEVRQLVAKEVIDLSNYK